MNPPSPSAPIEARGRSAGKLMFGLLVAIPTLLWAVQIIEQAFSAPPESPLACRDGLLQLISGIEQARQSATTVRSESEAIRAFRANLGPIWEQPRSVREKCKRDPELKAMFGRVERLRYAEEHAVRYETRGIAADRRAIERAKNQLRQK